MTRGRFDINDPFTQDDGLVRVHMSDKIVTKVRSAVQDRPGWGKPKGFWYGFGRAWLDWVDAEMPEWRKPVLQQVIVDTNLILQINNLYDFEKFEKNWVTFRAYPGAEPSPDWQAVAKRFAGIEINPYQWQNRYKMWYYPWDVASGCVWHEGGVKGLKLIAEEGIPDYDVYE